MAGSGPKLSWREAIIAVLRQRKAAARYADIAEEIVKQGLREKVGATPANTVYTVIFEDIKREGDKSTFLKAGPGLFMLRAPGTDAPAASVPRPEEREREVSPIVRSMGIYWQRDRVDWKPGCPKLLGQQVEGSDPIDFANELGVYLLYDGREVIYVGQVVDQPLAKRLRDHLSDRLNGRWDRFSWFGLVGVRPDSDQIRRETEASRQFSLAELATALEALLIEALEPRQNRRRGQDIDAIEYQQATDPEIEKRSRQQILERMAKLVVE